MTKTRGEMTELDFEDPLDWVYEVRRRISEKYGHDIKRYTAALLKKQRQKEAQGIHINYVRLPIVRRIPTAPDSHG